MTTNIKNLATGIVVALIGVMVGFILTNALFSPTNTAVTDLETTLDAANYTTEADLSVQAWKFYLLAIPLLLLGGGVKMIISAFK